MVQRSRVELPSPGNAYNYVVLTATRWQSLRGISRPKNVGKCTIYIKGLDDNDKPIPAHIAEVMTLNPGDFADFYEASARRQDRRGLRRGLLRSRGIGVRHAERVTPPAGGHSAAPCASREGRAGLAVGGAGPRTAPGFASPLSIRGGRR